MDKNQLKLKVIIARREGENYCRNQQKMNKKVTKVTKEK